MCILLSENYVPLLRDRLRQGFKAIFLAATIYSLPLEIQAAELGDDYQALTPEQAQLADQMLAFVNKMEAKFFNVVERFNGNAEVEDREFNDEKSSRRARVARGNVIEKAGLTNNITRSAFPPFLGEPLWNRYIMIDFQPKTPLVGLLHITMTFRYEKGGKSSVGGVMQIAPGTRIEEDFAEMRAKVDAVFEKYGADVAPYRETNCSGPRHEAINLACSGVSFYTSHPFDITEKNFNHVSEIFETLFDAYIEVLEKRKDQEYTDEDLAAQDRMRRAWFEDHLFEDEFTVSFVPYEAWTFTHAPPVVKY